MQCICELSCQRFCCMIFYLLHVMALWGSCVSAGVVIVVFLGQQLWSVRIFLWLEPYVSWFQMSLESKLCGLKISLVLDPSQMIFACESEVSMHCNITFCGVKSVRFGHAGRCNVTPGYPAWYGRLNHGAYLAWRWSFSCMSILCCIASPRIIRLT